MTYHDIIWAISALLVLGFITLAIYSTVIKVEDGVITLKKWRNEHVIVIPEGAK